MKNILYLESGTGYGGSAKNLMVIIKYLDRSVYNPIVVAAQIGPQIEKIMDMGVRVYRIPILKSVNIGWIQKWRHRSKILANVAYYSDLLVFLLTYLPALFYIFRKHKISLVHGNNGIIDHFPVIFVARFFRIPVVLYISGTEYLTRIERFLSRWVHHIILLNPLMRDYYRQNMGNLKSTLIDNGVDLDEIPTGNDDKSSSVVKASYGIKDEIVIGTMARIVPGKGLRIFINAAKEITRRHENTKFIIIGDNPLGTTAFFDTLKTLVNESGLSDHVIFAGWQNDIYKVLQIVDVVAQVSSTFPEGMSLAPIEAMALSKPVIVSDNPGYERTIVPGVSGLRVPAGDAHALARAIIELIDNPVLAKTIAVNGRNRVEELLNAGNMVNSIQAIYESLLAPAKN